ncbi:hypothetical protein VHEMI06806 [[Torrubiella] hemipterigena]|uniref:F-box domain-containing protein n=1 Tax=[Torrubiella] hemipterigena TaxID=1531966 RepID=A0A0A1TLS1_9HYPO|nr:hypothetical protein VHEMI06806 [[Torrubiella] hemipterigena]
MVRSSLITLPDELLHDVVGRLDSARDVAAFQGVCRRTDYLTRHNGWKSFAQAKFPSLKIPASAQLTYSNVADRLTYLDRCWAKRAFFINSYEEELSHHRHGLPPGRRFQQSVSFYPCLDAGLLSSSMEELLVVGAGEDVLSRRRPNLGTAPVPWMKLRGAVDGYMSGSGDVTAVSVVDEARGPGVAIGRADGSLRLQSIHATGFKGNHVDLLPELACEQEPASMPPVTSLGHLAVTWTAYQQQSALLASCQGARLRLYDLSSLKASTRSIAPSQTFDFTNAESTALPLLRSCKFLGSDTIACALGSATDPLQWGQIRPDGIEMFPAVPNMTTLSAAFEKLDVDINNWSQRLTVRAIEPVHGLGGPNIVLSAWDNGSINLHDLRTASPYDAVYRDRFQPYQSSSALLAFGAEHFVAGDNRYMELRVIEFRNPTKSYQHTDGLSCSSEPPFPPPLYGHVGLEKGAAKHNTCSSSNDESCVWHRESRRPTWQPDVTINMGNSKYDRCFSLAKSSDVTGTFYAGFCGAVMEITPALARDVSKDKEPYHRAPKGWTSGHPRSRVSLIETGVSLCSTPEWALEENSVPAPLYSDPAAYTGARADSEEHMRLDSCWTPRRPRDPNTHATPATERRHGGRGRGHGRPRSAQRGR